MTGSSEKGRRAGKRDSGARRSTDGTSRPDVGLAPSAPRPGARVDPDPFAAERARLEAELAASRRNEEHLRGALAAARVGTWEWDVIEGRLTTGGDAVDVLGRGLLDVGIGGQVFLGLVHPEDRDGTSRAIGRALVRADRYRHEYRIVHPTLGVRWIQSEGTPVVDETGRVLRMTGVIRDVTERKQTELALREREEFIRQVLDTDANLIFVRDAGGRYVLANRAMAGFFGRTPEEMVGEPHARILPRPEEDEAHAAVDREVLLTGRPIIVEETCTRADGAVVWFHTVRTPLVMPDGRVHVLGIATDVTLQKRAKQELVEAKLAAEAADLAKTEFLATMSHELRTPLTIVLGYAEMLAAGEFEPLTDRQHLAVGRLRRNAGDLLDLISAVLDLSRLGAGRLPFDEREISVGDLLREISEETVAGREASAVEFGVRIEDGLPQVRTDPGKLKIVIKNLVQNAFKFTEKGEIRVDARARDRGVEIGVSDTGVGIPEEEIDHIFEPFHQVDVSAAGAIKGTGLGLHIVQRLMQRIGGTVKVESRMGRGSTFRIWVPAAS